MFDCQRCACSWRSRERRHSNRSSWYPYEWDGCSQRRCRRCLLGSCLQRENERVQLRPVFAAARLEQMGQVVPEVHRTPPIARGENLQARPPQARGGAGRQHCALGGSPTQRSSPSKAASAASLPPRGATTSSERAAWPSSPSR